MTRIELPKERQIGHLTLLRQGRQLSLKEYNALSNVERLEMIHQASGKQKYELLINANDNHRLLPRLHPQELYLTLNEIGSEYAVELLALASPEQITTLLDLDCWDGDCLSPVLSLHWLQLLLETGPEQLCRIAEQIEPELLALFLTKHIRITRGIEVYDDDESENARRLEGLYDIEYASEDAAKIIGALLQILAQHAQETYLLLMEMIRSETAATLEEEVFQARNNRLGDLGFVPRHEAKSIYSYLEPDSFTPGGKVGFRLEAEELQHPGALLAQAAPRNLLGEVLSNRMSHELASELCLLANRKMSADTTDTASSEQVGAALQALYDTLNLALEQLAGTDVGKAEEIVRETYLLQLFQYGHSLIKKRQRTAEKINNGPLGPFFDYPEQLFIESLLQQPAALYRAALEDKPSHLQAIATAGDLQLVDQRLQQLKALEQLFCERLPFDLPEPAAEEELTLSSLFLTAVANQLLGRPFAPQPLELEDLFVLQSQTCADGQPLTSFGATLSKLLGDDCGFFCAYCLECWQEEFAALDPDRLDNFQPFCLLVYS